MKDKKIFIYVSIILLFLIVVGYHCPIYSTIGIPCPGCGMTRSFIALMQGNIRRSFYFHALCIPTIICAVVYYFGRSYRTRTAVIWCVLMIGYYIYRMIVIFPRAPMNINPHSLVQVLIRLFVRS